MKLLLILSFFISFIPQVEKRDLSEGILEKYVVNTVIKDLQSEE